MSDSVRSHRRQPTRLLCPWDSPGKNTGVRCHFPSNAWKWKVKVKLLSCVWLLATPWTAVHQASLSMGFSRQEYWSGVLLPSPNEREFEWTPGVGDGQGGLACWDSWGRKELDTTERLNWTELNRKQHNITWDKRRLELGSTGLTGGLPISFYVMSFLANITMFRLWPSSLK